MKTDTLTAPKLRLKPLFLIGAIVVLAGILIAGVDHVIWAGMNYHSYYEGWRTYICTSFAKWYWYPDEFFRFVEKEER